MTVVFVENDTNRKVDLQPSHCVSVTDYMHMYVCHQKHIHYWVKVCACVREELVVA